MCPAFFINNLPVQNSILLSVCCWFLVQIFQCWKKKYTGNLDFETYKKNQYSGSTPVEESGGMRETKN
jgi:hypothetical protein